MAVAAGPHRVGRAVRRTAVVIAGLLAVAITSGPSITSFASPAVPATRGTHVADVAAPAQVPARTSSRLPDPTDEQRRAVDMPGTRLGGTTPNVLGANSVGQRYVVQVRDQASLDLAIASLDTAPDVWNGGLLGFGAQLDDVHVAQLQSMPGVITVEPDRTVTASASADELNPPWGLDRIDQRSLPLNSTYSYSDTSNGAGVTAYVIDTGLWFSHTEFTGRVPTYAYWDFGGTTGPWDCDGHGTHVAGTVGGTKYGVAKQVSIVPVKVLNCNGSGTTESVVFGINWVIANHVAGVPAVANLSLGGDADPVLDAAVEALIADGVTVVVAAGNESAPSCNSSPGRVPDAITVAASDSADIDATFSNFGACNDLFAPGVGILSASPPSDSGSAIMTGTSMAAPHVAGAAALVLQRNPSWTPAQVWSALDAASTKGAMLRCCGDPDKLLYVGPIGSVAGAPTGVTGAVGNGRVAVSWVAPEVNGGSPIFSYMVTSSPAGRTCVTAGTSCVVTGLTNGTGYTFTVVATNSVGASAASAASATYTPAPGSGAPTVPGAPTGVVGVVGNGQVSVSWFTPVDNGGSAITGYLVISSPGGNMCNVVGTSCVMTDLTNGAGYTFVVAAANANGVGPPSVKSPSVVPQTVPGAPTGVVGVVGNGQLAVSWVAPVDDGGSPVTGYTVISNPEGRACITTGTSCTVTGLTNGTGYTFTVVATNNAGSGLSSSPSATLTPDTPVQSGATQYVPVTPARLVDTRPQSATGTLSLVDACTIRVPVAGQQGVPSEAVAAALTVTIDHPSGDGWAAVYPAGTAFAGISNVNFRAGEIRANSTIVQLGAGAVDVRLYAGACGSPVVVDVTGAFVPATADVGVGRFVPTTGQRIFDSRTTGRPLPAGTVTTFTPATLGIPADATAVTLNVTVANTASAGFVAGYPTGTSRGLASMLNADGPDEIRAGFTIVPISPAGLSIYQYMNADLIIDVVGYMSGTPTSGGAYVPAAPTRVLDTRPTHLTSFESRSLATPAGARAIVANWTITESTSAGWIAVRPSAATGIATTSTVNAEAAGDNVANLAITHTDPGGITAQVGYTTAAIIVDYAGYFTT